MKYHSHICDMIKRNESDVGDIVFEIMAKIVFKSFRFILFIALTNSLYLRNQLSNINGVCIKIKHFELMRKSSEELKKMFDK